MTKLDDLHKKWLKNPDYKVEYEGMRREFEIAAEAIAARTESGLLEEELATGNAVKTTI